MTTPSEDALDNPEALKRILKTNKFRTGATAKQLEEIKKNLPLDSINAEDNPWRKKP